MTAPKPGDVVVERRPVTVRDVRLDLIEESALRASRRGILSQEEPADLLLMIDEIRAARALATIEHNARQMERAATLTEIQRLADIYRDNCAYGRPNSAEAVLLAVWELNEPFDDLAAKALTEPPKEPSR